MRVCVLGLWHLGVVTAGCAASVGHEVTAFDFDSHLVDRVRGGELPVSEPGLAELVGAQIEAGRLAFESRLEDAVKDVEVLWVAFDTPVDVDDNADIDHVVSRLEATMPHLPPQTIILLSSQLPVGSARRIQRLADDRHAEMSLSVACSPENLRLGNAIEAFLKPDRVVVGVRTARDKDRLLRLMSPITDKIEWMSVESAEMAKHAINAFLATSVVFANEIASLSERVGADAKEVERALRTEARIGPRAYLSPGAAFAGGTLARDVAYLNQIGASQGVETPLLSSIKESNNYHKQWSQRKLITLFPDLSAVHIAMWGLTYKAGTDTLRRSNAVELVNWLLSRGAQLSVHDPAVRELPGEWTGRVSRFESPLAAVREAHGLVVSTEWPQYRDVSASDLAATAPGITVLDPNRFLAHLAGARDIRHVAVGSSI